MSESEMETLEGGHESGERGTESVYTVDEGGSEPADRPNTLLYSVGETPPWYLCVLLGFQHYLTAVGSLIGLPILLSKHFCMDEDMVGVSELIGTVFCVSGLVTLLQTTFGVRLPIVQGVSFAFVAPTIAIMLQDQWKCEYTAARNTHEMMCVINRVKSQDDLSDGAHHFVKNSIITDGAAVNFTDIGLPPTGSDKHREMWMKRIREIQGTMMVAGLFQLVIGFSGIMGFLLRFIGPLSITPTISLIGLSLFGTAAKFSSQHWWIALATMVLVILFSQYCRNVTIPCFTITKKGFNRTSLPICSLFPVLLAMVIAWVICTILTVTDVLPTDPNGWGYKARTDIKLNVIFDAKWFRFPYPGQWGMPTVSAASVLGMFAGVIASMVESMGDYYACARLSGAPPPPTHAVNRGLGMEGLGCILAGAWGTGNGTTSFSQNIGAIGITKVGSLRVVQTGGAVMLVLGCFGKFAALFVTIPDPIFGGIFCVVFGMVTAVGLSNLQHVNLNSPRNIFIIGISLFLGLSVPVWMASEDGKRAINTGEQTVDQVIKVLLSTSMFVGGVMGFVLDNTIPGTPEERGIISWRKSSAESSGQSGDRLLHLFELPFIQGALDKVSCFRYIPCCPAFMEKDTRILANDDLMSVEDDM